MTDLTRDLRDRPELFLGNLRQEPLSITVDGGNDQAVIPGSVRQTAAHPNGDMRAGTIRGLDRVAWVKIERSNGLHNVKIYPTYPGPAADAEPCYWLPWKPDATVRIKLRPSKKLAGDGALYVGDVVAAEHAHAQRAMLQDLEEDRRAPRLFFTAMLTGCGVHIEGDTNAPNVIHSNASSMGGPLVHSTWRFQHYWRLSSIDNHLTREYGAVATPGVPNVGHLGPYYGYDFRTWPNATLAAAWGHGAEFTGANTQVQKMKAAVFGVCVDGQWRFYGQRIYFYFAPNEYVMSKLGTLPRQIWPGAGTMQI